MGMAAVGTTLSRNRRGQFRPGLPKNAPTRDEAEELDILDEPELDEMVAEQDEPPVLAELENDEVPVTGEAGPSDPLEEAELAVRSEDQAAQQVTLRRVQAMLQEALRLGRQVGLVELQADGTLAIAGHTPRGRREDSECHCQRCSPWQQQHWWCVVCWSGPHDWHLVKPQYERQVLKPGGIEGARHAACSSQCARDYLSSLGRQPQLNTGVNPTRTIDPTLGLPGASNDDYGKVAM